MLIKSFDLSGTNSRESKWAMDQSFRVPNNIAEIAAIMESSSTSSLPLQIETAVEQGNTASYNDAEPMELLFARIIENAYQLSRLRRGPQDADSELAERQRIAVQLSVSIEMMNQLERSASAQERPMMPVTFSLDELPPPTRYVRRQRRSKVQIG